MKLSSPSFDTRLLKLLSAVLFICITLSSPLSTQASVDDGLIAQWDQAEIIAGTGNNPSASLTSFSISFWLKTTDTQADALISDSSSGFTILLCEGGFFGFSPGNQNTAVMCGTIPLNDGQWHHVVFTYNGLARVHIDGERNHSEDAQWGWGGSTPLEIDGIGFNRTKDNLSGGYDGTLDDVRIYNRVLNSLDTETMETVGNDVEELYAIGSEAHNAESDPSTDDDQDGPSGVNSKPSTDDEQDGPSGINSDPSTDDDQDGPAGVNSDPSTDDEQDEPVVTETIHEIASSRSSVGGSGSRILARANPTGGQVLGASTSCGIYLSSPLSYGSKNDPSDMEKLHAFLSEVLGIQLPLDGIFGTKTLEAVKQFQLAHKDTVIDPWIQNGKNPLGIATGFVGTTTLWTINNMVCPTLQLPKPVI